MGVVKLVKATKIVLDSKAEIDRVLKEAVSGSGLEVEGAYSQWRQTFRLSTVACCGLLARQFYQLEDKEFDSFSRAKAYIASATACLADDLIDNYRQQNPREVYFLDDREHRPTKEGGERNLFYRLNEVLQGILPTDFRAKFGNLIQRYNVAQVESDKLGSATPEEVVSIKDATGGYPFLLFYKILFPETAFDEGFIPDYNPKRGKLPTTKSEAIFNFGAMISRLDDLSDLKYDLQAGRKSLATESLTSWNGVQRDIAYVTEGFQQFYPKERVDSTMGLCSPKTIHAFVYLNNLFSKLSFEGK